MTTTLKTYIVTCICQISTSIVVNDKIWKKAAKKAEQLVQEDVEIDWDYRIIPNVEVNWQKPALENAIIWGDGEWEVCVSAEVIFQLEVDACNWKEAAKLALELAQNNLEVISDTDVNIDWQRITEDMVD
jgi:hypothetical protein